MQRIIRCGGPVEDDMANIIVAQLLYLDAVDPNKVNAEREKMKLSPSVQFLIPTPDQ